MSTNKKELEVVVQAWKIKSICICKSYLLLSIAQMIHKNIIAFKGPHLHPHLMVSGLEAENVPVALKLRNVNIQKTYCENNFTKKINPSKAL